ncbi:hypothetical protein MACH26_17610 [Planctobacterium marinum]|uniref:cyclic-guanylate-specific phosphodiesterase n=1 Tax=Planctobacterium marinum TaxID=1631968 RepID=A0AA48I5E6_9ALTE|nr:hypothetical protein MACH26_17610 [Planctobacterium marinum]
MYWRSEKIIFTTLELVETQLPTYDALQKFESALTRQERYLYEYYATQNSALYHTGYRNAELDANARLMTLQEDYQNHTGLATIQRQLKEILPIAEAFNDNMAGFTNWDLAREQLAAISAQRRAILPHVETIKHNIGREVATMQNAVEESSYQVRHLVFIHFAILLMVAFIVARAIKSAMQNAAFSHRLALFPKRNPNPVMSFSENNEITFHNPASEQLWHKLGETQLSFAQALSPQLNKQKQFVCDNENHSTLFELEINGTVLKCGLHWLTDVRQWDMHVTDITAQKQAEKDLQYQATHHVETGLCNQYALREYILKRTTGKNFTKPFSFLLIALSDFDQLQITKGFQGAQQVVNQLASSVSEVVKQFNQTTSMEFHISDNNFAVVIDNDPDGSHAEVFINQLENYVACALFHFQYQPQLHYGVTRYPNHGQSLEDLLRTARHALDAIEPQSDMFTFLYDKSLGERVAKESSMVEDMKQAIDKQSFRLHFQPQVDIASKQLIGAEVLVRWPRESGWVSPGEFIPLAEKSGQIVALGDWILREACFKAKQLYDVGNTHLVTAVNISPKQFARRDFLDTVKRVLKESKLPPENLELEITEGVIMNNESQTIETLQALKSLGILLAIDDFGTGYSSLSYLKKFPIDKLKIDQSFVRDMHQDSDDEAIVRTVINLGRNLNLKLIAEGVEEQSQWSLLHKLGCHEVQGYFFSKPLEFIDFQQFSAANSQVQSQDANAIQ